jgi:hypothetical protein
MFRSLMRITLAAVAAAVMAACGVTEPERSLSVRLLQEIEEVNDNMFGLGGEVMMVNGLAEPVMVYPGCTEDYEGLDRWTGREWVRVQTHDKLGRTCTSTTLAPGASAILEFMVSFYPTTGSDWPASRADIPGKYRLVFGAGRVTSSGRGFRAVSDPIELRLASGKNLTSS